LNFTGNSTIRGNSAGGNSGGWWRNPCMVQHSEIHQ